MLTSLYCGLRRSVCVFIFIRLQFRHHKPHCQSNPIKSFKYAASAEIYMSMETHNEHTFFGC